MYSGLCFFFITFCSDHLADKREANRIKIQNYRRNRMTDKQKLRYHEVNRKTAAAKRLQIKNDQLACRNANKLRQQKCRLLKQIPDSPNKYKKIVQIAIKAAEKSPRKRQIFQDCLASFKAVSSNRQSEKQVSVLEL